MFGVTTSDDYKPVTWMGRYPVDVTTILVASHITLMVLTCVFLGLVPGSGSFINWLMFDSALVLHGNAIHQIISYAFVHSPSALLWFAIEMYMLFAFGREVERFLGRRTFIWLYALLLVAPTLVLTLVGAWLRVGLAGSGVLHFGIFLAFVIIYPSVEMMMVRLPMKWIALILLGIGLLADLAIHDWGSMIVLSVTAIVSYFFMRTRGVGGEMEWWENLKMRLQPKPKFQVVRSTPTTRPPESEDIDSVVDPLLEKISKHGINSLTASERRTLDRARNQLLRKSP